MIRHLVAVVILCAATLSLPAIQSQEIDQRSSMVSAERAKFIFKVKTQSGGIVGGILIEGKDLFDCISKLMQRYPGCTILEAQKK